MKQDVYKLYRFSHDGFQPKQQSHHLNLLREFYQPLDETRLTDWQKQLCRQTMKENEPKLAKLNLADWDEGVFAFFGKLPQPHWIRHELNHLSPDEVAARKLHVANLDALADVYSPYNLIPEMFTAKAFQEKYGEGVAVYVPKRSLCLLRSET